MKLSNIAKIVLIALFVFCTNSYIFAKTKKTIKPYTRYMGTYNLYLPTAKPRTSYGYLSDDGDTNMFISQALMNSTLELSYLKHVSGDYKDKNVINCKIPLLNEGNFVPSIVWGASDITKEVIDKRIYYFAASKSIDTFGITFIGGFYKDPAQSHRKSFYGVNKVVFPLVSVAAECENNVMTYGLKLSPVPGLDVSFAQRNGSDNLYGITYNATY